MPYDSFLHHRRSIRLQGFDYRTPGYYFLTVCTKWREPVLGEVVEGRVRLNQVGKTVESVWHSLSNHFPEVDRDEFVVMPNHVHGIVGIVGAGFPRPKIAGPRGAETAPLQRVALGQIVAYFKYRSSSLINQLRQMAGEPVWQRNYYERIIRNDAELARIRQYIRENPAHWEDDPENVW